jgi:tartrate dehydrogenase/decarboxylase/D-malate dehydrogenase
MADGTTHRICVIPGDGIGPEVVTEALRVLDRLAVLHRFRVAIEEMPWGSAYFRKHGRMMPADAADVVADADATLFGAVGSPDLPDDVTVWGLVLPLRHQLDLYVNLRPIRRPPGLPAEGYGGPGDVDWLIIRENVEGEYSGAGGRLRRGTDEETAVHTSVFTARGTRRILDYAFAQAGDGLLTSVTKSNALPHTMTFWDEMTERVAAEHPTVRWERMHVDAVAYKMIVSPGHFDTIVASNLFGDILSDLGAGLQGSLGLAASANLNPERGIGMFEPVHGSAPDIAGQGIANPVGAMLSVAMMLDFLVVPAAASALRTAIDRAIAAGATTPDLGGACTTSEFTDEVLATLDAA